MTLGDLIETALKLRDSGVPLNAEVVRSDMYEPRGWFLAVDLVTVGTDYEGLTPETVILT